MKTTEKKWVSNSLLQNLQKKTAEEGQFSGTKKIFWKVFLTLILQRHFFLCM
jgi:hypothetical protein